jgi:hypothetical protein
MFLYLVLSITYLSDNEVGVAIMPKKGLRPKLQFLVISKSINLIALGARADLLLNVHPPSFPLQLCCSRINITAPEIRSRSLSASASFFQ